MVLHLGNFLYISIQLPWGLIFLLAALEHGLGYIVGVVKFYLRGFVLQLIVAGTLYDALLSDWEMSCLMAIEGCR